MSKKKKPFSAKRVVLCSHLLPTAPYVAPYGVQRFRLGAEPRRGLLVVLQSSHQQPPTGVAGSL